MHRSLPLRQILADSHVAAVTVTVLLVGALDSAFRAIVEPCSRILTFVLTAIAIRDIPFISSELTFADRIFLETTAVYLYASAVSFAAAWLLSRWVFRLSPLQALARYKTLIRRSDA